MVFNTSHVRFFSFFVQKIYSILRPTRTTGLDSKSALVDDEYVKAKKTNNYIDAFGFFTDKKQCRFIKRKILSGF